AIVGECVRFVAQGGAAVAGGRVEGTDRDRRIPRGEGLVADRGAVGARPAAGRVDGIAGVGVGADRRGADALGLPAGAARRGARAGDVLPRRVVGEAAADGGAAVVALGAGVVADRDGVEAVGLGVGAGRDAQVAVDHGVVAAVVRAGRLEVAGRRGGSTGHVVELGQVHRIGVLGTGRHVGDLA